MHGDARTRSLDSIFDPTSNSLNAIRLALAILVVASHSWPVTGVGEDPLFGGQDWGDWAVGGFFAISGYLITASRDNTPRFWIFAWKRFLRLYPAFLCALLAVAFIAAPLSSIFTSEAWNPLDSVDYVWRNSLLLITQPGVGSTLSEAPIANSWNNPLWTLAYESACYGLVGLTFSVVPRRFRLAAVVTAGMLCFLAVAVNFVGFVSIPTVVLKGFHLGSYFAAGAFLYLGRFRITLNWPVAIGVIATLAVATAFKVDAIIAPLPLALLLMWGGAKLPLQRLGARNDISYGMYIYAFPVQQLLHLALPAVQSPPVFALMSVAITLPLAWMSYRFVEKPALQYKSLWNTRPKLTAH